MESLLLLSFLAVSWRRSEGRLSVAITEPSEEGKPMCANCGCGVPEDKHGDDRNISWSEVVASAEANSISPAEAIQNMQAMAQQQA
jgi:hypothetical protein